MLPLVTEGGPQGYCDTQSPKGRRLVAGSSWPHPLLRSLLAAPPPRSRRTGALALSPGLLSHWNGVNRESASRKGHLQPLASDAPASWPLSQRPQLVTLTFLRNS